MKINLPDNYHSKNMKTRQLFDIKNVCKNVKVALFSTFYLTVWKINNMLKSMN